MKVKINEEGYLIIPAEISEKFFNTFSISVVYKENQLIVYPVKEEAGGIILKYRNSKGDRSALIREFLPPNFKPSEKKAIWNENLNALLINI